MYEINATMLPLRQGCGNAADKFEPIREGGVKNTMPNIKSAEKRVKVIKAKTLKNKMFKSQLRTVVKKYSAAIESGNAVEAAAAYKLAVKKIDQAVSRNIMHKNTAARKKSQFTREFNNLV